MIRHLPRALVARYAPAFVKRLARRGWQQLKLLRQGRQPAPCLFVFAGRTPSWPDRPGS